MDKTFYTRRLNQLLPLLLIFLCVTGYMIAGYLTLDDDPRRLPMLTGYITLILIVIEIFSSSTRRAAHQADMEVGSIAARPDTVIPPGRELVALLYVGGLVLGIYIAGFFVAIPVYLLTSIIYLGQQSWRLALMITLPATLIIYVVFELLLEYRLFPGVLLS